MSKVIVDKNQPGKVVIALNTGPQGPAGAAVGEQGTGFLHYTDGVPASPAISVNPATPGHMTVGGANTALVSDGTVGTWVSISTFSSAVADDVAKSAGADINRVRGFTGIPFSDTADGAAASEIGAVPVYSEVDSASIKFKKPVAPGAYDVTNYGAVGDGVTDDTAAIQAVIDSAVSGRAGIVVTLPPGDFYCANDLHLTRTVHLRGSGPALSRQDEAACTTKIRFAAGKMLHIHAIGTAPRTDGFGEQSLVSDISFIGDHLPLVAHATTTAVSLAAIIRTPRNNDNRYYFECIKAGTTAGTAPDFRDCYQPDTTTTLPANGSTVIVGTRIRDVSASTAVYFKATTGGVRGSGTPAWNTTPAGTTSDGAVVWTAVSAAGFWLTDGTAVWACKIAPGIWMRARSTIKRCQFVGFTNCGIHVQPDVNANIFKIYDVAIELCGAGISVRGLDSSQGVIWQPQISNIGSDAIWTGSTGGVGVWDGSFTGCHWQAPEINACHGPGYIMGMYDVDQPAETLSASSWTLLGGYMEGDCDPPLANRGLVLGGNFGEEWPLAYGTIVLGGYPGGNNNIVARDTSGAAGTYSALNFQGTDQSFVVFNNDHATPTICYSLSSYENAALNRTGWWARTIGSAYAGLAFSGWTATEGPGWDWTHTGTFRGGYAGTYTGQYFLGLDTHAMRSHRVRKKGKFEIGDRFDLQSDGDAGTWTGWIVTAAGWRGIDWPSNTLITAGGTNTLRTIIEPTANTSGAVNGIPVPGGQVWECTTSGTTGMSEPTWPGSPTPGVTTQSDGSVVWTYLGTVPEYRRLGFIDDVVIGHAPQTRLRWRDTDHTDEDTAAAKASVDSYRFTTATSAVTANQVLATIALNDNTTNVVDVVITGKLGSSTSGTTAKLSGSFTRNGATVTRLGTDDASTPKDTGALAGSTFNLNISSTSIQVRATPGTATATDWAVVAQVTEGSN